jgi:hypothetical protein
MYDPGIGRWLELDPEEFEAGDANLYRYVQNNPIQLKDPSGLDEFFGGWKATWEVGEYQRPMVDPKWLPVWTKKWRELKLDVFDTDDFVLHPDNPAKSISAANDIMNAVAPFYHKYGIYVTWRIIRIRTSPVMGTGWGWVKNPGLFCGLPFPPYVLVRNKPMLVDHPYKGILRQPKFDWDDANLHDVSFFQANFPNPSVFFVRSAKITNAPRGWESFGHSPDNKHAFVYSVASSDRNVSPDKIVGIGRVIVTTAHEIGHLLDLPTDTFVAGGLLGIPNKRLMAPIPDVPLLDDYLTKAEEDKARKSSNVTQMNDPK